VKEYIFYDQHIYMNGCVDPLTKLMTYQFIIFIFRILFL
jgi:hypothetical protein